jgi:hypothetical protein
MEAIKLEDRIVDTQDAVGTHFNVNRNELVARCCMLRSVKTVRSIVGTRESAGLMIDQIIEQMCESNDSFIVSAGAIEKRRLQAFYGLVRLCLPVQGQSIILARYASKERLLPLAPDDYLVALSMVPFDASALDAPKLPVDRDLA